jgi:1,4-dihydroxy-2-naphthoyl-CoA hydrolase
MVDDLYSGPFRYAATLGIRITDANKDRLVGELDVDDRHLNNSGHVHGGAFTAFADDLGGTLAGFNVPPGVRTTTIESKTSIFRACLPGRLTGVACRSMWGGA